ncbi:MAG: hypothetical protein WBW81_08535 [Methylocella sp.]
MSDIFTERRPMIDLDVFERRLCGPCSTDQRDGEPLAELAELLRMIGGEDESHETGFDPKTPLAATARQATGEPGALNQPDAQVCLAGGDFAAIEAGLLATKQPQPAILPEAERSTVEYGPNARAPLISGDFAAIEAGLLGAPREQATATVSEANMSNAFSSLDVGSQRFLDQDDRPVSRHAGAADGQNRARRPLYVMVAIVIVAMAGVAVGIGLKSRASGPPEIASIEAGSGATKLRGDTASGADAPAQEAAILSKPPEPSPMAIVNGSERTLYLPQVQEKTLPAESHAQIDNRSPAAPPAPAQAQTPAEPLSMAAPIEPEKMKTDVVRPDATLLSPDRMIPSNGTPPQAIINEAPLRVSNGTPPQANINETPHPVSQSPAAAKVPAAKAVGRVAKPRKPTAARDPARHGQPRQIANKAKAMPVSPSNGGPAAPIGDPKDAAPATQPNTGTNGALGFVQNAVNSLTSATAKLLEWGR